MPYNSTARGIQYPDANEDVNIPGDMELLANTVNTAIDTLMSSNFINSVTLAINDTLPAGTGAATVTNGELALQLPLPEISNVMTSAGGTFTGDVDFDTNTKLSVNDPTLPEHAANKSYVDSKWEIGMIIPTAGAVPAGWHICDGRTHGSAALQAAIGSPNTPNLVDRFLMGTNSPSGIGVMGGNNSTTLSVSNLPVHNHSINNTSTNHTHSVSLASAGSTAQALSLSIGNYNLSHRHTGTTNSRSVNHNHWFDPVDGTTSAAGNHGHDGDGYKNNWLGSSMAQNPSGTDYSPIGQGPGSPNLGNVGWAGNHTHTVYIGGTYTSATDPAHTHDFTSEYTGGNHSHTASGSVNISHNHSVTVGDMSANSSHSHTSNNAGSGTAFSSMPAYYKVYYIIYGGI